ncbi:unnamed protein product [Natator depressus]
MGPVLQPLLHTASGLWGERCISPPWQLQGWGCRIGTPPPAPAGPDQGQLPGLDLKRNTLQLGVLQIWTEILLLDPIFSLNTHFVYNSPAKRQLQKEAPVEDCQ